MSITIRKAAEADLPGVVRIINWAIAHSAANFSCQPESVADFVAEWRDTHAAYPWYVATESNELIGYTRTSKWKGRCAYAWAAETSIYLDPAWHRKGVGRALYQRLIRTMSAQGYRSLLGGVTIPNPASERLHESLGFRRVAHLVRMGWKFNRWHDVVYYELTLGGDGPPTDIKPVAEADREP